MISCRRTSSSADSAIFKHVIGANLTDSELRDCSG